MNWFTTVPVPESADKEAVFSRLDDYCEHVEADHSKLYKVSKEHDSMGSESYGVCEECWNKIKAERDEEEKVCYDCKHSFKMSQLNEWRWYDFYAPQGDEPLIICNGCLQGETHRNRVAKDDADYRAEMGHEEDPDDDWTE